MAQYTITIINNSATNPTYTVFQQPPEIAAGGELRAGKGAKPGAVTIDFAGRPETTATVTYGPNGGSTVSYG